MENKIFYPESTGFEKSTLLEIINTELIEVQEIEMELILEDDPRLTDELCQEIVNAWMMNNHNFSFSSALWADEDNLTDEWALKLFNIFKPSTILLP